MSLDQAIGPLLAITLMELDDHHGLGIQLTGVAVIASGRRSVRFEHYPDRTGHDVVSPRAFCGVWSRSQKHGWEEADHEVRIHTIGHRLRSMSCYATLAYAARVGWSRLVGANSCESQASAAA